MYKLFGLARNETSMAKVFFWMGWGGRGAGRESTQQRRDQVITLSQQGLTFVGNFPDSAMNGPTIDQKPFVPPRNKNRTSQ